ncbi:unnamed protein product [Leptidea sinapis]|uniref:Uncharacterized protein n=1 Tax=Leptidea sinapis TaxID=189913 RepID=A0A5E4Q3N7_9NEOP|nr:unnamed protein product [Leptidea sinapis]
MSDMESSHIPYFATYRQSGTVILRLKMDESDTCCGWTKCPVSRPGTGSRRSECEQCLRTRSYSKYSDCDSEKVDRCKPYRSRTPRSRYVNVCAAVCLVLLVGGLSPQSSAAPHKRTMDRQRRSPSQENSLWGNPCDYDSNSKSALKYTSKLAKDVASQARNALESTAKYKDKFASKLHSFPSFEQLLPVWSSFDWLRNFTWFPEEGLPKEKLLFQPISQEYMDSLMELMRSRKLQIMTLPDSELPKMDEVDKMAYALLVYRDTLNYLEYIAQVFQTMYEMDSKKE